MSERSPLLQGQSTGSTTRVSSETELSLHTLSDEDALRISEPRGLAITVSMFILIFLSTCNVSALTTLQSSIAVDLDATTETSWFISAMLISSASVTPLAGKLCQVFSEPTYLVSSAILQAIGLLLASMASTIPSFLCGEIVYGAGQAALAPVALILVKELAPERLQGLFFGLVNCAFTSGVACGAIIGGAMEHTVGWRAVFWMQAPVVLVVSLAAFFAIPKSISYGPPEMKDDSIVGKLGRLDFFGTITLVASVVFLLYSLSAPKFLIKPIVLSFACLMLFLLVEAKWAIDPIIPKSILTSRGALLTGLATIGVMSARWAVLFYMPAYGIAVRQWTAEKSGLLLIPSNIGFGSGGVVAGWFHVRRTKSYYLSTLVCYSTFVLSMLSMALLTSPNANVYLLAVALLFNGFIMGALLVYTLAHVLFLTEPQDRTMIIPVNMMFRNLAGAFGSSFSGGTFLRSLKADLTKGFHLAHLPGREHLIEQLLGQPMLVQKLQGKEKEVAMASYSSSLCLLFYAGMVMTIIMVIVQAGTGWRDPERKGEIKQAVEEDSDTH